MKEFLIHGFVANVETKTSKQGTPYSIIKIEDKDSVIEVVAGSKVQPPTIGSSILCRGSIRSTPRTYQERTFYSYSFFATAIEPISGIVFDDKAYAQYAEPKVVDAIVKLDDFGDEKIPF